MTWPIDGEGRFSEGIHKTDYGYYVAWHEGIVARIAGPVRNPATAPPWAKRARLPVWQATGGAWFLPGDPRPEMAVGTGTVSN